MNNQNKSSGIPFNQEDNIGCPNCEGKDLVTTATEDTFTFGTGPNAVKLTATVSLQTCRTCGFQFLDSAAEDAHHEAICQHLGVLNPCQIQQLRRRYQLSRSAFSQLTKLGEASIARWERGELIQNAAYDQLLYLLLFEENFQRLQDRATSSPILPAGQTIPPRFRVFKPSDADREAAGAFEIRRCRRGA